MKKFTVSLLMLVCYFAQAQEAIEIQESSLPTIMASDIPHNAPQHSNFPAIIYKGKLAKPRIGESSRSKQYRTKINISAREGINFAGQYNIAIWGCGIACHEVAITDMKTGRIYHPKNLESVSSYLIGGYTGKDSDIDSDYIDVDTALGFHANSKLLVVGGPIGESTVYGISYFLWQDNELKLIKFSPLKRP